MTAEMSMVYHSDRSLDCTLKILHLVFKDSIKASKMSSGQTKDEVIVVNVLVPYTKKL